MLVLVIQWSLPCKAPFFLGLPCMVKLVYKDQSRDQQNVVLVHSWFLYTGPITWKVYNWRPVKCGLYKQAVFIAGLTVF